MLEHVIINIVIFFCMGSYISTTYYHGHVTSNVVPFQFVTYKIILFHIMIGLYEIVMYIY